jgi:hypothetical protein
MSPGETWCESLQRLNMIRIEVVLIRHRSKIYQVETVSVQVPRDRGLNPFSQISTFHSNRSQRLNLDQGSKYGACFISPARHCGQELNLVVCRNRRNSPCVDNLV